MIRSSLKPSSKSLRASPLRVKRTELTIKEKTRKCKVCQQPFKTFSSFVKWCSAEHGAVLAELALAKQKAKAARAERQADRAKREAMKTIPQLKAEAQKVFNAYIRERDKDLPCICCGKWQGRVDPLTGGMWDAGHYRSVGSADHLRFDERNVHRQLKDCNKWGAGRAVDYRIGLIARRGLETVEALEAGQTVVKWTRELLLAKKAEYRKKLKDLQNQPKAA